MASYIAIFNNLNGFYNDFTPIINSHSMHFYLLRYEGVIKHVTKIQSVEQLSESIEQGYHSFYLTSVIKCSDDGFYDKEFRANVIEGTGGKLLSNNLQQITLRIVSHNPDTVIKKFFNKLKKQLDVDSSYGKGVNPPTNRIYLNTYYKMQLVENMVLWFDYEKKIGPTTIID